MSPFLLTSLVCLSCLSCHLVTSYPFGAPACVSSPRHGPEPQTSELELKITRDVTQDGDIKLQLGHPQSESTFTFRGFLVKTTAPGKAGNIPAGYKGMSSSQESSCSQRGAAT